MKEQQNNSKQFIPNFTQYPNEILDEWMPHLTGNQTKIMNVFVRQIFGFHKQYDKISIRQIAQKTGITSSGVFKDLKILISLGAIKILKKGSKADPHTYQIINITEVLFQREHKKKHNSSNKGVTPEITGCYPTDNTGVIPEITEVLSEREQQKKEINIKESVKESENRNNIDLKQNLTEPENKHTPNETYSNNLQDSHKTSLNPSGEVLSDIGRDIATIFSDSLKIENIDNSDIESKYDSQIKEVTNKYNHLMSQIPKLTTSELIGNSEKLMSNLGIGFDDNPRRILNKIYNSLPNDHSIMEDSKDIELVQEIIGKYKSSNPETRSAISKRLYQALELMVKIYYIKKYGEEYRGKLYPEIIDKNLVLYLNCNPTLKYCYSGFSNDIDGVFDELKRIINKKNQKLIDEIENEKQKELSRLEAYRKDAIHSAIPEELRREWQEQLHNIMTGKSRSTETVNVIPKRTEKEELEFNQLREETAELFKAGIRPETWMRERLAELSAKKSYY